MRVKFYGSANDLVAEEIQKIIDALIQPRDIDVYPSIESLSQGLRVHGGEPCIAVLVAGTRRQLQELLSIKNLIAGYRTLLFLPDDHKETISHGHRLVPRYVGFAGDDLSEFSAVLGKTIQLMQKNGNW